MFVGRPWPKNPLNLAVGGVCLILVAISFIIQIEVAVNDDAFIYFNYARNIVQGRLFAYDPRNLPSEGFTSLLFLLLLVPFEATGVNPHFAAMLINLAGMILMIVLSERLIAHYVGYSFAYTPLAYLMIAAVFSFDGAYSAIVGYGLDTILGPPFVLLALLGAAKAVDAIDLQPPPWALPTFFASAFLAYLVRPENLVFLGAAGLPLLLFATDRSRTLRHLAVFLLILGVLTLWKASWFGDFLPTGFYRKVSVGNSIFPGLSYVIAFSIVMLPTVFIGLAGLLARQTLLKRPIEQAIPRSAWVVLPALGLPLVFYAFTSPLIGFNFRFLINTRVLLHIFVVGMLVDVIRRFVEQRSITWPVRSGTSITLTALACGVALLRTFPEGPLLDRINLYQRAVVGVETHPYILFGRFLNTRLSNPADVTLVFGDAGAIPYSLGSRFIDTNGLSEPAIAHLFRLPDGPQKTTAFIEIVLAAQPDMVVLGYGDEDRYGTLFTDANTTGVWGAWEHAHDPFRNGPTPPEVYDAYRVAGIGYVCSIETPWNDLHIGLSTSSAYYADLKSALQAACAQNGYTLPGDFTVISNGKSVIFPALVND